MRKVLVLLILIFFINSGVFAGLVSDLEFKKLPEVVGIEVRYPANIVFYTDGTLDEENKRVFVESFLSAFLLPASILKVSLRYDKGYEDIISDALGKTILGKVMLEQDLFLKKVYSTLYYPGTESGRAFWSNFIGATNVTVRYWICPGKVEIIDAGNKMLIKEATLSIKQEIDAGLNIRELNERYIIPSLERYVNYDYRFAPVRLVFRAIVFALWLKEKYKQSIYAYWRDSYKIGSVVISDKYKEKIWKEYVKSFENKEWVDWQGRYWGGVEFNRFSIEVKKQEVDFGDKERFEIELVPEDYPLVSVSRDKPKKEIGGIDFSMKIDDLEIDTVAVDIDLSRWQYATSLGYYEKE